MSANTINQMSAIRNELLESHIRITTKNEALILELKAQIEALILENEAHEDEIAIINDLQDAELAWIAEPPEPEGEFIGFVGDVCWENKKAMEERDKKMDEDRAKRQAEREAKKKEIEEEVKCWQCEGTDTLGGWITYKEGGERHCGYCCDSDGNPYFTCGKCEWSLFIEKHMKLDGKEHEFQFDLCRACYAQEHDELLECADCDCKGDPIHFNRGHKGYYCDDCLTPELAKMM